MGGCWIKMLYGGYLLGGYYSFVLNRDNFKVLDFGGSLIERRVVFIFEVRFGNNFSGRLSLGITNKEGADDFCTSSFRTKASLNDLLPLAF